MKSNSSFYLIFVLFLTLIFSCKKDPDRVVPTATVALVTNITAISASCGGEVTSDGGSVVTARGVCWGKVQNPTIANDKTTDGTGVGVFTRVITSLTPGTTYNIRAYAVNTEGTGYSSQTTFTTLALAPILSTTELSAITTTSVSCGGNITTDGGTPVTARGVCWSTNQNPTIADSKTTDGTGVGSFSSNISPLTANTTYYLRAYATNSVETTYGTQKTFTTLLEVVFVQGGTFQMGSNDDGRDDDELPVHTVIVDDFFFGKYEVTQAQWEEIMGNKPSNFKGDKLPVEQVSWNDVQIFISKLNAKSGNKYRLPTEAEWEYAARGGNKSLGFLYAGSNILNDVGWHFENSGSATHIIGSKLPNELGLYDMSGNVWEWCNDWYDSKYYANSPQSNPKGSLSGVRRVCRGGSWGSVAHGDRIADRNYDDPDFRNIYIGIRLASSK